MFLAYSTVAVFLGFAMALYVSISKSISHEDTGQGRSQKIQLK